MTLFIENNQNKIPTDVQWLESRATEMLTILDYQHLGLNIRLTDNKEIQEFNKKFRDKDKPTDILSFPFYPDLKAGERLELSEFDEPELGDIVISLERVQTDADELGVTLKTRLERLLAHGIAHLLGYDHQTDLEHKVMLKLENQLMS
jgi:probable rRNA maturation factor